MDRIPSEKVVVLPASKEKVYPDLYVVSFRLGLNRDGSQPISITFRPYNFDTKEIDPNMEHEVLDSFSNVWDLAAKYTKVSESLQNLVNILGLLHKSQVLKQSNDPKATEKLIEVERSLGAE